MLTVRTQGPHQLDFVEDPEPVVGPGEVMVRMRHVALCGTDLHIWEGTFPTDLPLVQGHEMSGVIAAIGPEVDLDLQVGQPVAVNPSNPCGSCLACRTGRFNCCTTMRTLGCFVLDGGLTELLVVPAEKVCPLPAGLSLEVAALGEPMSIAMQAVRRGRPRTGETALVTGCGPIGVLAALYLTELGVRVVAADIDADRAEAARAFGAEEVLVVDPAGPFPSSEQRARLDELSGGDGVSLIIEATGVPASTRNAIDLVAHSGRIVQVGISRRDIPVPIALLTLKELDLLGSRNSLGLIPEGLQVLARHQEVAQSLITHRFPIGDLERALETMRDRTEHVGKIVIDLPA